MKMSDILGWLAVLLFFGPAVYGIGVLLYYVLKGAPIGVKVATWAFAAGVILFIAAVALFNAGH